MKQAGREVDAPNKCRIEVNYDHETDVTRYVVTNWRRAPSGAGKRIIL